MAASSDCRKRWLAGIHSRARDSRSEFSSDVAGAKLDMLREADAIYLEEIGRPDCTTRIWQAFAVLLPVQSVGVMGDERTYEDVLGLRAVTSDRWDDCRLVSLPVRSPRPHLQSRSSIEVTGVNRVVYDISSKPPSTIEWE